MLGDGEIVIRVYILCIIARGDMVGDLGHRKVDDDTLQCRLMVLYPYGRSGINGEIR